MITVTLSLKDVVDLTLRERGSNITEFKNSLGISSYMTITNQLSGATPLTHNLAFAVADLLGITVEEVNDLIHRKLKAEVA